METHKFHIEWMGKCNDARVNKFVKFLIQIWRGNCDISSVTSMKRLIEYITK